MNPEPIFSSSFKRALILCAHTDDEFGCAGTISRLVEAGVQLHYLALSRCEESVPSPYPEDILEVECRESTRRLGIDNSCVEVGRYPVRYFPDHRQAILEQFVRINREYQPDLVLLPSSFDIHQDHGVVFHEGLRAFKFSSILGYELPQNTLSFTNAAFVKLTEEHLQKKIWALESYQSQKIRPYSTPEFIRSLAHVRGVQCNSVYAEAFEALRWII